MKRVLVLGVGSPMGADRLGWLVIEALQQRELPDGVVLKASDRPGPAVLTDMSGMDGVIIVDAVVGDSAVGEVVCLQPDDIQATQGSLSSHGFGLAEALLLGRAMDSLPSQLCVLGICFADAPEQAVAEGDVVAVVTAVERRLALYLSRD